MRPCCGIETHKTREDHEMADDVYERLAEALDKLPNGFPRTPSNVEIAVLKKIFSPEEASLASQLRGEMEPLEVLAE